MQIATLSLVSGLLCLSAFNVWSHYNTNQSYQAKTFEIDSIKIDESFHESKLEQGKNVSYARRLFECNDEHCVKCPKSQSICDKCEIGYQIKNMICEKKTPELNSEDLVIIMAAIFSPMFFIVICCLL